MTCLNVYVSLLVTVPGEVENLLVEQASHNLTVTWSKPSINKYCVKNYYVEWKDPADNTSSTGKETDTEIYDIQGLSACMEYEVSVRAVNLENSMSTPVNMMNATNAEGKRYLYLV